MNIKISTLIKLIEVLSKFENSSDNVSPSDYGRKAYDLKQEIIKELEVLNEKK